MELLDKLEEIKQQGNYSMNLTFGEGVGADDSDIPKLERRLRLICYPVGFIGECKKMWIGEVKDFLDFDFNKKPTIISNPPKEEEYEAGGYFVWGTESAMESFKPDAQAQDGGTK